MKLLAFLYISQLSATNYNDNSGCELLAMQLNKIKHEASSWSSILNYAESLNFDYSNKQSCKEINFADSTELQIQVIYGSKYIWYKENSCIQLIEPENKVLTNRESEIFSCLTNSIVVNTKNETIKLANKEQYIPDENKCGSTYYYAEIIDDKVVYKDSCGNIIKNPNFN